MKERMSANRHTVFPVPVGISNIACPYITEKISGKDEIRNATPIKENVHGFLIRTYIGVE